MFRKICYILTLVFGLVSCDWVSDDLTDCPDLQYGLWLKFTHFYNMEDVDKAMDMVGELHVQLIDKESGEVVINRQYDQETLRRDSMRVNLGDVPQGDYEVLVWGGTEDPRYQNSGDHYTLLQRDEADDAPLTTLFYGLENIRYTEEITMDEAYVVDMMNDVNNINVNLMDVNDGNLPADVFEMQILGYNQLPVKYDNSLLAPTAPYIYRPYNYGQVSGDGLNYHGDYVRGKFSVLRLMEGSNDMLQLYYKPNGKMITEVRLVQYIIQALKSSHVNMPNQEFLDRENNYDVIILMEVKDEEYVVYSIEVRPWIVRQDDALING